MRRSRVSATWAASAARGFGFPGARLLADTCRPVSCRAEDASAANRPTRPIVVSFPGGGGGPRHPVQKVGVVEGLMKTDKIGRGRHAFFLSFRRQSTVFSALDVLQPMNLIDLLMLALCLITCIHVVVRRFQDRFEAFSIHMGLFLFSAWMLGLYVAGWAIWLTLPLVALAAAISQYVYMRDSRSSQSH